MKNLLLLTLLIPSFLMAMHHKSEPIIFYLDMDVTEGKAESLDEFVKYLVGAVKKTEPIQPKEQPAYDREQEKEQEIGEEFLNPDK